MLCQTPCSTVVWFPVSKFTVEKPLPLNFCVCFPETLDYIGLLVTLRLFTQVQNNGHWKHCPNMSAFSRQMFDVPGWTEWQWSCNNFYFSICKKMKYVSWRTRIRNSDIHILYFWTCILDHLLFYRYSYYLFSLKWFPAETSKFWYFAPRTFSDIPMYDNSTTLTTSYLPHWVDASWLWIVAVPLLWFTVHTVRTLREYRQPHQKNVDNHRLWREGAITLVEGWLHLLFPILHEGSWIKRDFITKFFLFYPLCFVGLSHRK